MTLNVVLSIAGRLINPESPGIEITTKAPPPSAKHEGRLARQNAVRYTSCSASVPDSTALSSNGFYMTVDSASE